MPELPDIELYLHALRPRLVSRRRALGVITGGVGLVIAGCSDDGSSTTSSSKLRTSQLALPEDACNEVFATAGYEASVQNLAGSSLDSDMVFSDGYASQLAKATGSVADGYTLTLNVGV